MIAKGHDFPAVTLVGVLSADLSLNMTDYRAEERTFQLLVQVAGRAGRGKLPGYVVLQTYSPDHYAIRLGARQEYREFYHREMQRRQRALYPPYAIVTRLLLSGPDKGDVQDAAVRCEEKMNEFFEKHRQYKEQVVQMRMMEAPLGFLQDTYRYQVYVKWFATPQAYGGLNYMAQLEKEIYSDKTRCRLEVNPASIL